ncbi:MAG: sigma-70 family RNA polymerase sigma factor [Eubacterium sp.]
MKELNSIEEMYEEYYPKLYNYIYYRTLNRETTEDIVSEVFLKVMYRLRSYRPERGCFSTWIYTIAKNTLIDYFRKNHTNEDIEAYSNVCFPMPDDFEIINNETLKRIRQALAVLNDRERLMFYYKYYLEMPNKKIAQVMEMNESTVSTVIQRAHVKIKNKIKIKK